MNMDPVKINCLPEENKAHLLLRCRTSAISEKEVVRRAPGPAPVRADEETLELLRRLAVHHSGSIIAGVRHRQGPKTAPGEGFTAGRVSSLRHHCNIPRYEPQAQSPEGEPLSLVADQLGVAPSTLLSWLNDGFIGGEQVTPGAPGRIRTSQDLKALVVPEVPPGYVTMPEAMRKLGVSGQTIMQRVKRGELSVGQVSHGKHNGLRISVLDHQPSALPLTLNRQGVV